MKVLLSFAFMCCFIGGIVGDGCDCEPLKECYDKNNYGKIRNIIKYIHVIHVYSCRLLNYHNAVTLYLRVRKKTRGPWVKVAHLSEQLITHIIQRFSL